MNLYTARIALAGIWRERWINLLCVLTVATCLFLIAAALVLVHNVDIAAAKLPERFSVIAYLRDGVSEDRAREIAARVKDNRAVRDVRYISAADALAEVRAAMKNAEHVLEGLEGNPLPASLEIRVREAEVARASTVEALAAEIMKIEGVGDVDYGRSFLTTILAVKKSAEVFGVGVVALLGAAMGFIAFSTVKMLLYRREREIETLKLLGATRWFIRAPYLIEGGVLGFAGGAVGALVMYALHAALIERLVEAAPLVAGLSVPGGLVAAMPAAGLVIGMVGAFLAVGKISY